MFYYLIGYGSHENSGEISLVHKKEFTKEEFDEFVVKATVELLLNRREQCCGLFADEGDYWADEYERYQELIEENHEDLIKMFPDGLTPREEYLEKYGHKFFSRFEDILDDVVKVVCELYGFKPLKYTQQFFVNGWGDIVNPKRSFGEEDELLEKIRFEYWKQRESKEEKK